MRNKYINLVVFILSAISLSITVRLFWNMGIYVDEYSTSPNIVYGGEFWTFMSWLRLLILVILTIISVVRLFDHQKD